MATQTKAPKKKKQETAVNNLHVAYVLDMSGSMISATVAAREATKGYLADPNDGLWKQERDLIAEFGEGVYTRFSLTVFDTVFERWIVDQPVLDVDLTVIDRYQPRGYTALYDAVANTITDLETQLKQIGREQEKCLVVVMTDGAENSSREYGGVGGRQRFFDLIKAYEKKGNWTFCYLGADVDAYAESAAMGFSAGNTASYAKTDASMAFVSTSLGKMSNTLRRNAASSSNSSFADAGLTQDYTDPEATAVQQNTQIINTTGANPADKKWSSSSAADAARSAR